MTFNRLRGFFARRDPSQTQPPELDLTSPTDFEVFDLIAYTVQPEHGLSLDRAPKDRPWIDATHDQFAYRCLPMLIANQSGWIIRNSHRVLVEWNGGDKVSDLSVAFLDGPKESHIVSLFGYGIVTWRIPFLFRTSDGVNILARGPANTPKHGAHALEGVVETDWAVASFTMNWKITRPGEKVLFEIGEPICLIVPQRRGDLERVRPEMRSIESAPELKAAHLKWRQSRRAFTRNRTELNGAQRFQRHYLRGTTVGGEVAETHQVKLSLKPFTAASGRD